MSRLRLTPDLLVYLHSRLDDEGDLSARPMGEALDLEDLSKDNSPILPSSTLVGFSADLYLEALSDTPGKLLASLEEIDLELCSIGASLCFSSS